MTRSRNIGWFLILFFAHLPNLASAKVLVDQQVSLRTFSGFIQNPVQDPDLYPSDSEVNQQVILRDNVKLKLSKYIQFELNFYNLIIGASDKTSLVQTLFNSSDETNRTADLERHWHSSGNVDSFFTIDRLNLRLKIGRGDLTIGRFPVNMTNMFIFTTNDFFAPFRAFEYYREYKPGVDAIRFDHSLGKKGQISVLGVAGYNDQGLTSRSNNNPPSRNFSPSNASAIARIAYTFRRFEGAILGGKLASSLMAGASLQGEIGEFGLRAEGNQRKLSDSGQQIFSAAFGVDRRLTSKLTLQIEQYFNGGGIGNPDQYTTVQSNNQSSGLFLNRNYTGLNILYDISGLWNLRTLVIINDNDKSVLGNLYLAFSVASNAQLVLSLMSPHGKGPNQSKLNSEFGTYPGVFSVQTAIYF